MIGSVFSIWNLRLSVAWIHRCQPSLLGQSLSPESLFLMVSWHLPTQQGCLRELCHVPQGDVWFLYWEEKVLGSLSCSIFGRLCYPLILGRIFAKWNGCLPKWEIHRIPEVYAIMVCSVFPALHPESYDGPPSMTTMEQWPFSIF